MPDRTRTIILGAGGRDFHVFNTRFRADENREVVAITAAQIPNIDHRTYPPALAGPLYPNGVPIVPEDDLEAVIAEHAVTEVVFAYSDVTYDYVDALTERVAAAGATLRPFDVERTLLRSTKPVVAVCAVRTGCGKSALSRHVVSALADLGLRCAAVRHPMPYGRLGEQIVQRFERLEDLDKHECTIEEMEEYEPHIRAGGVVFAGVDYGKILAAAEEECDIVLWDGGNNDAPFFRPDLMITLLDPLRPGDELRYFPSRWNLEHADILVMSKREQATDNDVRAVLDNVARHNPGALVVDGNLAISCENGGEKLISGRRVLVVEDGPTVTHGGMGYGAGLLAARRAGAAEIIDPRPFAEGQIAASFEKYTHLEDVLPALGYGEEQLADLAATIGRVDCDAVVIGTPIDLTRILEVKQPVVRVNYDYAPASGHGIAEVLRDRFVTA